MSVGRRMCSGAAGSRVEQEGQMRADIDVCAFHSAFGVALATAARFEPFGQTARFDGCLLLARHRRRRETGPQRGI